MFISAFRINSPFNLFYYFKFFSFTACNANVQTCSSYARSYAISSTSLSSSLVTVYTNSLTFSCSSTGYKTATQSSSSDYLYLPKGSMAYLSDSTNMILAVKSNTQTPDYLANAASPYILSNMSSPLNNQQIYFAVIATYVGKIIDS